MFDQVFQAFWARAHHRRARGKCFQKRDWHIIDVGSIDEDISRLVERGYLPARNHAYEFHPPYTQLVHEFADLGFRWTSAEQVQSGVRKFSLHFGKRSDHQINAIVIMKAAGAYQMRTQW